MSAHPTARIYLAFAAALWLASAPIEAQEDAAPPAAVGESPTADATLSALRNARDTLIGIRDFSAALNPALAAVTSQEQARSADYPADLAALALIQAALNDLDASETRYLEAIEVAADTGGEYSPILVDLYRGLGRVYIRAARYPDAIAALELGQHISQRNFGLFNVEQSGLLDDITTAYLGLGDTGEAQRVQLDRLENAVRRFGADDPRVIPFRYVLAEYYERSRLPESAGEQYEEVLRSQEARLGGSSPELMAPLRALAKLDLLLTQTEEEERRDRLAALMDQNPDAPAVERGLTLALLGDWSVVAGDSEAATDYYQRSWRTLAADADFDVASYFAKPSMIDFVPPLNAVDRGARSRPYAWAQIVLEFDVAADGTPSEVKLFDESSRGTLAEDYIRRMSETHFRPRLVSGEPVATEGVRSTHYVRYYVPKPDRRRGRGKNDEGEDDAGEE